MRSVCTNLLFLFLLASCNEYNKNNPVEITRNDLKIAYQSCGSGDTTLLFVHGWCINKEYWEPQVNYFCPKYKVVTIDLPGFGQSGKNRTDWSFDEYTEDIKAIIEQLKLKNVILIGHSMSGDIILNVSNKYPSLVLGIMGIDNLHEPGSPFTPEQEKGYNDFFDALSAGFDSTVNNYMKASLFQPSTDSAVVKRVMNNVFTADSSIAIQVLKSLSVISQKEKPLMLGLAHKLYLLNSDVVPIKTDSLNKYCMKGFQVELVQGTGHYPMIEKPAEFNTALQKIIYDMGKRE